MPTVKESVWTAWSFVKYVRPTEAGAAASTGTFVNVIGMQSIDQILGELGDAE